MAILAWEFFVRPLDPIDLSDALGLEVGEGFLNLSSNIQVNHVKEGDLCNFQVGVGCVGGQCVG